VPWSSAESAASLPASSHKTPHERIAQKRCIVIRCLYENEWDSSQVVVSACLLICLGGVAMIRLTLSPEEQAHLEQTRRTRLHLAERCHYVLLNAQGWSVPQIAQRLNRNEHTIRTWLKAYRTAGLPGLHNTPQSGRPATTGQR